MSQSFFFVVASKIGDFANQFLNTVLQCCPTVFGRFSHPDAHYFCHFLEFGRGMDDFLRKNRIISAAFRGTTATLRLPRCETNEKTDKEDAVL